MREKVIQGRLIIDQYRIHKMTEGLTLDQLSTLTYQMFDAIKGVGFTDLQEFENASMNLNALDNTYWR